MIPGDLWDKELWRAISGTHIEVGATEKANVSHKLLDIYRVDSTHHKTTEIMCS